MRRALMKPATCEKPRLRWALRGGFAVLLPAVAAGGCGGSVAPAPPAAASKVGASPEVPAAAVALTPARWFRGGGLTEVGPKLAGGTLLLAGGRRTLVAADGSVRVETVPTSEALVAMLEVPGPSGGMRLVGHGEHMLYRFDDPLGAPVVLSRVEGNIRSIAAGPGVVAVWDDTSDLPRFVHVETGAAKPFAGLAALPARAMAFRNAREGAGIFAGVGLFVTTDGGATWAPAKPAVEGDALRVKGLRLRAGSVRAFVHPSGRDASVDVGTGRLGTVEDAPAVTREPPLVQWIRKTGLDPIETAVTSGVEAPRGGAIIGSHGLLGRVDTTTGALLDLVPFAGSSSAPACMLARAGDAAWAVCPLSADSETVGSGDAFGVLRIALDGPKLTVPPPLLVRDGEVELRGSPSGGVMLLGPCNPQDSGQACVRQPDGQWVTFSPDVSLFDHGAGPLMNGKIAIVRNLYSGDVPEEDDEADRGGQSERAPEDEQERRPYFALIDPSGREQRMAELPWIARHGDLRVQSPIEEGEDQVLRAIIEDDEGVYAIEQPPGRSGPPARRIAGAAQARMAHGRGIAVGRGQLLSTIDRGKSWQPAPVSKKTRDQIDEITSALDDPTVFSVSEVGAKIDTSLRVGWGPAAGGKPAAGPLLLPDPPADRPALAVLAARPRQVNKARPRVLSCKSEATVSSTPILASPGQAVELLQPKTPIKKKDILRTTSTPTAGRADVLETMALLEEERPAKPGSSPVTWTLRWMDPTELSATVRTLTGSAPKETTPGAQLVSAASSGPRVLFTLHAGSKHWLVRPKKGGAMEIVPVDVELLPSNEVVFGTDAGEPIAWIRDTSIIVWLAGETPRVIGHVAAHPQWLIGQPTKAGVPVFLSGDSWSLMRSFPIPPLDKRSKTTGAPPALPLSLQGWQEVPDVRRDIHQLAACGPKPSGAQVVVQRMHTPVQIDGAGGSSPNAMFDLRISPSEACVAQVAAVIATAGKPPRVHGKSARAPQRPAGFVRADFTAKKAEGGTRGLSTKEAVRKMACALVEKP